MPLPVPGRWTWESARGCSRAVRVSPHAEAGLVTVSLWRTDRCVGSVHLTPAEAAELAGKVTGALAELASGPGPGPGRGAPDAAAVVAEDVEERLRAVERRNHPPAG